MQCDSDDKLLAVRDAYENAIEPFKGMGQQNLKRFTVFFSCFYDYEESAEREVMGERFAAAAQQGFKVPAHKREPYFPHLSPEQLPF